MNKIPKEKLSLKRPVLSLKMKPQSKIPVGGFNPHTIAMSQRKRNSAQKNIKLT